MRKNIFSFIFSDQIVLFPLCFMLRSSNYVFPFAPIFPKDHMNMSYHGNQIAIFLLKTFFWHSKWNKMEHFWRILGMTTGFYTKRKSEKKSFFFIKLLISP